MPTKKEIAIKYLDYLEKGDIEQIIKLFNEQGIVDSPIYGIKKADAFYRELSGDTTNSELHLKGIFEETNSNKLALYFNYKWTLKNKQKVEFDVVDIIEFDASNMISKLKIIYDTVKSRELIRELEK
ncbi:MAG: nuclear transport factor 2 family protein [Eudoraea sp.]|jgi:hypothetical protein|uniref:nuclear transport factor 2 family protein n=1 Tax=Eudoraea sp. TaxID=1979955 RepID=UPI0035F8D013